MIGVTFLEHAEVIFQLALSCLSFHGKGVVLQPEYFLLYVDTKGICVYSVMVQ